MIYAVPHDVGDKPQKDKTWVASAPGVVLTLCVEEDVALDSLFDDTSALALTCRCACQHLDTLCVWDMVGCDIYRGLLVRRALSPPPVPVVFVLPLRTHTSCLVSHTVPR